MTGTRHELFSMLAQAAMHHMGVALIPPLPDRGGTGRRSLGAT